MSETYQTKPKILIFSLAYLPFVGGSEIAIKEITDRVGDDFEFEMLTHNFDGRQKQEEQLGRIKVYRLGKGKWQKYLFPFLAYRKAIELHKKNNYQLIWANMANQAGLAAYWFKKKFPQIRYLLMLQEGDSEFDIWLRTWFIRSLYKAIYRRADFIQAISTFLVRRARKMGYQGEIEVVPNGISINKSEIRNPKSETNSKLQIKDKLGLKNKDKIILTVSRLVKKNGIEDLIKAFNLLIINNYKLRITDYGLLIVGDGPLRNKLQQLVQKLGLKDKVFFAGSVKYDDLPSYYAIADVFCRPSRSEGLGNVFLEAMAAGVPVIATPVGGIPDFLKESNWLQTQPGANSGTGWFCEPRNPISIAEKIKYVLEEKNRAEVEQVVANAKKMAEEEYGWEVIAEKMRNIFNGMLF